jgi:hypothetical protein
VSGKDYFLGRCIHGLSGAIFVKGIQTNPNCSLCRSERRIRETTAQAWKRGEQRTEPGA